MLPSLLTLALLSQPYRTPVALACDGGIVCTKSGSTYTVIGTATGSGSSDGGGAPIGATYITQTADATLTNEQALSTLTTGVVKVTNGTGVLSTAAAGTDYAAPTSGTSILLGNGAGGFSSYAGATCGANQYATQTSAAGALTCSQVAYSQLTGTPTIPADISGEGYWVKTASANLSNEVAMGALGTGLVINTTTTGVPTIKGSNTCTNQFPRSDNASGTWTCASVADADLANNYSGTGSCTNQFVRAVNDNAAPTCATVSSSDVSLTTTSCTNQFVTAISSGGVGTCSTATLAGAQFANQGTTTTVLHGNAAGDPSWAAVSLANDTTGKLPIGKGGTGQTTITTNQVYVGTALDTLTAMTLPSCSNATTSKLLYDNATQTFSCGTDQTGGGGGGVSPLFVAQGSP